jgi:hypothetical protein
MPVVIADNLGDAPDMDEGELLSEGEDCSSVLEGDSEN